jgi:ParB family chromosome partitioning protein
MAAKSRGLGDTQILRRRTTPDPDTQDPQVPHNTPDDSAGITRHRGSIVAALKADGVVNEIALELIADHPHNRKELGSLDDLLASIPRVGLLSPLIVTSSAAWLRSNPDHRAAIGDRPYLLLAGHRRIAAGRKLGLPAFPAIVREDLSGTEQSLETLLGDNLVRLELSPLEEARGYQLLIDIGQSQRAIAERFGRSQSHVSKRLALLTLTDDLQEEIRTGELTVVNAAALAMVPSEDQSAVYELARDRGLAIDQAHRHLEREREDQRAEAQAIETAIREGVDLIDPAALTGDHPSANRLYGPAEIEAARSAGELVAAATSRGLEYYSRPTAPQPTGETQEPGAKPSDPTPTNQSRPDPHGDNTDPRRSNRERRNASKRRIEAAAKLVQSVPSASVLRQDLAHGVLAGIDHANAVKIAHTWLGTSLGLRTADPGEWRESLTEPNQQVHAAWAIAIANNEIITKAATEDWPREAVLWVRRLEEGAAYRPTEWELRCIEASDSAGITPPSEESQVPL